MANKYKFESKEVVLNHFVVDIIGEFVKSGYTAEHILGSFLDYKKGVRNSTYPLVESWRGVNGSDFLTCYCDYIAKEKKSDQRIVLESECGIDEGFVSERFFRSVKATDNILIVNPHPQFVQSLAEHSCHITVSYTNDQYTEVMQKSKSKKEISYTTFGHLSPNTYNRILFFGQSMSTQQIVSALKQIKPLLIEDKDTIVYMQIPAKHIDGKHNRPVLREVLHSDYTVNQALMIDPDAAKGCDKKKLLLIMRNTSPSSTAEVVLQKIQLGERGDSRYLSGNETRHISYEEFLSGVKTLRATYDILGRDTSVIKQRETAVQFKYSKEIENVWISSMPTDKDVIRPKYAVYDTPSSEQKRTTKKAQGSKLYGHKQGPRMNSRNEAFAYALDFMLNDPKVVQVINDIVMRQYYHKSISLKSVWYLYNKEIQNLNLYDNIICEQMFCCAYNPESKLHNLIAGESTYSQICEAIKDYCTDNGLNNRQREKMLVQINLLWNVAVEKMHAATNPILDFHGEHVGANKTQELRNAMVLGSHGSQSISQLIANIQDHNSDPSLVVGFWLMLFLPLLAAEVCALYWKDFRKVTGEDFYQLSISKKFGATGTESLPILSRWLARVLPVIRMLEDILLKHKRSAQRLLMEQGRLDISIDDCPVIHAPGDPTKPVLTRTLNAFVRQMLSTLEIPSHLLSVPKPDGTFDTTDINKKQRNFLRSNFEHNMIIYAKMNADEIAYMLGRTPVSVLAMHYISRKHSFSQKGLFLKMRKWEKHILGNSNDDISLYAQFTDNVKITVPERNELFEIAVEIQCDSESPVSVDIVSQYGFSVNLSSIGGNNND